LLGDPAQILVEDDDPVPLGLFLALAGRLVLPGIGCRDAQISDRPSILGATDFRIGAQIADQDHFVDASRHNLPRLVTRSVRHALIHPSAGPAPCKDDPSAIGVIHISGCRMGLRPYVLSLFHGQMQGHVTLAIPDPKI